MPKGGRTAIRSSYGFLMGGATWCFAFGACLVPLVALGESRAPTWTNSLGMQLARIPQGSFAMGASADDPEANDDERLQHRVTIPDSFSLGVYEVTQGEFEQLMPDCPNWFSAAGPGAADVAGRETVRHPVDMASWNDASEFCRRLSALPAEQVAGRTYRLPSEAEWEYACRAGTTTRFATGDTLAAQDACFRDSHSPVRTTQSVGSYAANAWGLHDMHGNVWEWCSDGYAHDAYSRTPEAGPPDGRFGRVVRGGAFNFGAAYCRSANRDFTRATRRDLGNGFRVVCIVQRGG